MDKASSNGSIGIFDSGIGGLTVVNEITKLLPNENLIYLGDTARVPYGTRGREVITQFALELVNFLLTKNVKFLVVACNTISATCLGQIQALSPVPVLGVIKPAVKKIVSTTKTGKIGIIGTRATINSKVYEEEMHKINPDIKVFSQACPLFVPLAEEGLAESEIALLTTQTYLESFKNTGIDTLHLGYTHYPLLKGVIQKVIGDKVTIIDSAIPTADVLKETLTQKGLLNNDNQANHKFYVTDAPERVSDMAQLFFGNVIKDKMEKVTI